MTSEKDFFRQVMGQFSTGVSVVTTRSDEGLAGLTVNSFTSVSLDPPLVLFCVDVRSIVLPFFRGSGTFAINILTSEQEALARCFATSSEVRYEYFCHASYHAAATGSPIVDGALAFIDARVVAEYPSGDHVIFLGQVVAMGTDGRAAFASEVDKQQSALTEWSNDESGQASILRSREQKLPLVYYRAQYRHLARDYQ
jgi:flavin reductase (DIM6/NTAB) family NADH-FMN oxidoreductase RutF